jgi:hypothetical protein
MKKYLPLFSAVLITVFFASCNNGGKGISEVKLIPVKSGKDFQYIDQEGKIIINPQFGQATVFRNGLALVKSTGNEPKWGYITEDGKFAIMANYKFATIFSNDLAWVVAENAAPTAINNKGEIKITLQEAQVVKIFKEGLSAYSVSDSSGQKWGFVDKTGKIKINPQFSSTGNFNNGKCAVANQDGKWGYIDAEGKIAINYQFDRAKEFVDGKAVVVSGDKTGLIDENGKYVINPQFSDMTIDGDMFLIAQDGKWGWCDKEGKIIINPQFGAAFPFLGNDLAAVQSGKSYCYIDREGKIVINPQFDFALPFNGKLALVSSSNKIGFIDREGKYVINPQFDEVSRDLITYMLNGSSEYERVSTDYFNVGIIIDRLKKDITETTVAGMNFSTPMTTIFTKYKIQGDPNNYLNFYSPLLLISGEKISNDAILDMKIDVIPIVDNPTLNGFYYNIRLQNLGYNKADMVMKAFETAFNGYTKDAVNSRSDYVVLKSNFLAITAYVYNGMITFSVVSMEKQKEMEEFPGD